MSRVPPAGVVADLRALADALTALAGNIESGVEDDAYAAAYMIRTGLGQTVRNLGAGLPSYDRLGTARLTYAPTCPTCPESCGGCRAGLACPCSYCRRPANLT